MNYYDNFSASLLSYSKLPNDLDISFIMPNYPRANTSKQPSYIYAGGEITISFPFFCESSGFSSYMLLYTLSGSSTITITDVTYQLQENSLLFLDCNLPFKINSYNSNWKFQIMYLKEDFVNLYFSIFNETNNFIYDVKPYSCVDSCFEKIIHSDMPNTVVSNLYETKWLTDILTEICLFEKIQDNPDDSIPKYIKKAKTILDSKLTQAFSLDDLAEELQVNKYRLCREFSKCYKMPPLRYLNHKKMEKAKELLFGTNLTITEISTNLGIDNVNHFIQLFKKETGATPLVYKQEAPASIRELHSPYKLNDHDQ
jgi:AraC-like DNA-binding protein